VCQKRKFFVNEVLNPLFIYEFFCSGKFEQLISGAIPLEVQSILPILEGNNDLKGRF